MEDSGHLHTLIDFPLEERAMIPIGGKQKRSEIRNDKIPCPSRNRTAVIQSIDTWPHKLKHGKGLTTHDKFVIIHDPISCEKFSVSPSEGVLETINYFFTRGPEESLVDKAECCTWWAPDMETEQRNNVPRSFNTHHTWRYIPTVILPTIQPTVRMSALRMEMYFVSRSQTAFQSDRENHKNIGQWC